MKRNTIKKFLTLMSRDTGEDMMPDHLWVRWHGVDGKFYNKLWANLNGDNDPFLFDDYCDIGFELSMGDDSKLKALSGDRLDKLYKYSREMLDHYRLVSFFWDSFGFVIRWIIRPFFYKVFIPLFKVFSYTWFVWVLFTDTILDFCKEFGRFLLGKEPR